jgi:hypothetical protein
MRTLAWRRPFSCGGDADRDQQADAHAEDGLCGA